MTLQEILNMISMKYPHYHSASDIIVMINDIQKRIFRTMYKIKTNTTFDILTDEPIYPIDFSPSSIVDVVVDGKEYPYQNLKYEAQSYYYYITGDNAINLYPTPEKDVPSGLVVFHYKEPATLTIDSLGASPELDNAWHMLLVNHVCKDLASAAGDNKANLFAAEIGELEREFYKSRPSRPHRIQDVYGVGRGAI